MYTDTGVLRYMVYLLTAFILTSLSLAGWLQDGAVVSQAAATYGDASQAVTVARTGAPMDQEIDRMTLAGGSHR